LLDHDDPHLPTPNGLELTGDGSAAAGVRCSDVLGLAALMLSFSNKILEQIHAIYANAFAAGVG
jgi:hypothetical protein